MSGDAGEYLQLVKKSRAYWPLLLLPALFVGGFEYVRHSLVHEFPVLPGNLVAAAVAVLGSFFYYLLLFRVIHRLSEHLHHQRTQNEINQMRSQIASELHDSIAQTLFFANVQLNQITEALDTTELTRARREINSLQDAIGNAYTEVRQVIHDLNAVDKQTKAVLPSIRQRILEFRRQTGIRVQFNLPEKLDLMEQAGNLLLSALNESLWNIRKHAHAQNAAIDLQQNSDGIVLTVSDDGRGFDPTSTSEGFGIKQLHQRLRKQGGYLDIQSTPQQGTTLQFYIPIRTRRS